MWRFLLIFVLKTVFCKEAYEDVEYMNAQCISLCSENPLPLLDSEHYEQLVCESGCRSYNLIRSIQKFNESTTCKECYLSCNQSYIVAKENEVCKKGCDFIAATIIIDLPDELIGLPEPDLEMLEGDILSDPSIKDQLETGFNVDYKIPETHIRTMPIEVEGYADITKTTEYSGDWLDCASRNSGIPRWILLTAFLSAVLVALWLSFSTEKKNSDEIVKVDIADDKLILANEEKDPELLLSDNQEIGFSMPPKYTLESEKV